MVWQQAYKPFDSMRLSTLVAAVPVVVMLLSLGVLRLKAQAAAAAGLAGALLIAILAFDMPAGMATRAALLGGLTGLLPIGWIVLDIIVLHQLTGQNGSFMVLPADVSPFTWLARQDTLAPGPGGLQ